MASINPVPGTRPVAAVKPSIPKEYKARLYTRDGSLDISTNLPDRFPIGLSTGWDVPFNQPLSDIASGIIGGRAGQALQTGAKLAGAGFGQTTLHKWLSGAVWSSGSVLEMSEIPFVITAHEDPKREVMQPLVTLLKMVAPDETESGTLKAPGPHLLGADIGQLGGDIITLELGNFFRMSPCIIESVNGDFDTMFSNGIPISVTISVTIKSFWSTSKQDISKFFGGSV